MALVLISHDLGVIAETCDRVAVMYAGRIVEEAPARTLFEAAHHPYTRGLLSSLPPLGGARRRLVSIPGAVPDPRAMPRGCAFAPRCPQAGAACTSSVPPLLRSWRRAQRRLCQSTGPARDAPLRGRMTASARQPHATSPAPTGRGAACSARRRTFAPSIASASTSAPARRSASSANPGRESRRSAALLLGLEPPDQGNVRFRGDPMPAVGSGPWRAQRAEMQMIYQDPLGALDRRLPVLWQVREPLDIHGVAAPAERSQRALESADAASAFRPSRRRVSRMSSQAASASASCSRARWSTIPSFLVCDEPVSALDVSIQAQVVNLLVDLQARLGLAMLFISHDLRVVRQVSNRIAVMYLGDFVEHGDADDLFAEPLHPYTRALVSAAPAAARSRRDRASCSRASRPIRRTARPAAASIRAARSRLRAAVPRPLPSPP